MREPGETNAALYTLARVLQKRGDFAGVLRTTDDLVARMQKSQARPMLGLYTLRGDENGARYWRARAAEQR